MSPDIRILFHNISSTHNVGAMLRTADAIGVSHVYFSGYTPSPLDRFGRPVKEIAKTALGAEKSIPWEDIKSPTRLIKKLKAERFVVVAIEQDKRAIDYKKFSPADRTLIIVGNEVRGISKSLRDQSDTILYIPMRGKKESLNVSTAFGIVLFRIFDK